MKILCVIDSLGSGGAQRQLVNLAIGFKEKGHEVTFLTYHTNDFFKPVLIENGIFTKTIVELNPLKRILKIRSFIRKSKPDSILSYLESPNFICEVAGLPFKNWKLVVGERSADPNILKLSQLKVLRWFHLLADHIVANSHAGITITRKANLLLRKKKCHVIYNMIDFDKWKPLQDQSTESSAEFNLVVAASHNSYKNLNGLIEALRLLSKNELNRLNVQWYGDSIIEPYVDSSYTEGLRKIKEYHLENIIKFFPASPEISKVIQKADCVGLFSFFEGFPNVICEGMACAKPIISSKVSDITEILSYDSNILFDPHDIDSMKNSISYILNSSTDKLKELSSWNLSIARRMFVKEKIINQYLDLLKR